jgi:hypothetical protein
MAASIVFSRWRSRNPDQLALYAKQAPAFFAGHNVKFLARFGGCEPVGRTGAIKRRANIDF